MREISRAPRREARLGGLAYLVIIAAGFFSEAYVRGSLVVGGNAAATAYNILSSERLYRLGGAVEFVTLSCDIAVALVLYVLLRPVNRNLALLAAFFRLAFSAVYATLSILHFGSLFLLKGGGALAAFTPQQLQGLAMLSFKLHDVGYDFSLVFFGLHCLLVGGMIAASGLLPRIIGVLLALAGTCYLVNSFASLTAPWFAATLFPYILLPGFVAELCLAGWLSIFAVSEQRWQQVSGRT